MSAATMIESAILHGVLAVLPVLIFLAFLQWWDGYRLVHPQRIILTLFSGGFVAFAAYDVNGFFLQLSQLSIAHYSVMVAPWVEEILKAMAVLILFAKRRTGFTVDAVIHGFAVGAGFAVYENAVYLSRAIHYDVLVWVVRGFGTAFMHGGTASLFALAIVVRHEMRPVMRVLAAITGLIIAVLIHTIFNRFLVQPLIQMLLMFGLLIPTLYLLLHWGRRRIALWLGTGFDAAITLLNTLNGEGNGDTAQELYLDQLADNFPPEMVSAMRQYLLLHTKMALRAKGVLLMREQGFKSPADDSLSFSLAALRQSEKMLGRTGMSALAPLLDTTNLAGWQIELLRQ